MANFQLLERGDCWWELCFDQPGSKANVFTSEAMEELSSIVDDLEKRSDVKGLLVTSAKETIYIAGADIKLIQGLRTVEEASKICRAGQKVIHRFSLLPFETVAAINGVCLGGGLELALACKKCIASDSPHVKIGLPEVQLGILPAFGGSTRLPRKTLLTTALDLMLTGKQIDGKRAWKASLVSTVLPKENFRERALAWAQADYGKPIKSRRNVLASLLESPLGRIFVFNTARKNVQKKTKGQYPAPLKILDVLGKTVGNSNIEWCLQEEVKAFSELAVTSVSKRLIELFLLTERVKKNKIGDGKPTCSAAVLGAGIMGGGIAHAFAKVGIPVRMKDISNKSIALGYKQAADVFRFSLKRRRITPREFNRNMGFISSALDYSGFRGVDVVVEAVVENMDVKKKVLQEVEEKVSDDCVFASNTSSLSITELQSIAKRPDKVGGLHFFNPVNRMPLVEVIAGEQTSEETMAILYELSKRLKKTPIVVKDCAGFLVNRLLVPYMKEAIFLLEEGVSIDRIDRVMLSFGMPMGPLRLWDEVGIDTALKVGLILEKAYGDRAKSSSMVKKLVEDGYLGRKSSKGFYCWENGRATVVDETIYNYVKPKDANLSNKELMERMLFPMINEAALALEERVVKTPGELDLGLIMGTGFPPFRGGLLRYADALGLEKVYQSLDRFYQMGLGEQFSPSAAFNGFVKRGVFY